MSQNLFAPFPLTRPRRMRATPWVRDMVRENEVTPNDLIWPIFIREGVGEVEPIPSMPGVNRLTVDKAVEAAVNAANLGIPCIALFPNTPDERRSEGCEEAWNLDNLVNTATRAIKAQVPDIGILLDVALDPYSSHGHDGILRGDEIMNDETLMALEKQALAQAESGCDILGPSDMMDGRIGVIRQALEAHDFPNVMIMSYAAKYASAFYGPFRDAVGSATSLGQGDKRTYQIDPANTDEALREVCLDIAEGADMVMVKPALSYLDIVWRVKQETQLPVVAYNVSGEYAMIKAAAQQGWIDEKSVVSETLTSMSVLEFLPREGCSKCVSLELR